MLSSDVWGPHFWFVLHTIAITYPKYPNDVSKKKYYHLIQNLPTFLPNQRMGREFKTKLDEFPVTPYLSSRLSFMKWVHFMHNKINRKIGKPEISFNKGLQKYYKHYESKKTKFLKKLQKNQNYTKTGVCIFLVILIIYFYKNP